MYADKRSTERKSKADQHDRLKDPLIRDYVEDGRFTLAALNDAQVVTPEPATMLLMFPGMAGLFWHRRRKTGKQ